MHRYHSTWVFTHLLTLFMLHANSSPFEKENRDITIPLSDELVDRCVDLPSWNPPLIDIAGDCEAALRSTLLPFHLFRPPGSTRSNPLSFGKGGMKLLIGSSTRFRGRDRRIWSRSRHFLLHRCQPHHDCKIMGDLPRRVAAGTQDHAVAEEVYRGKLHGCDCYDEGF